MKKICISILLITMQLPIISLAQKEQRFKIGLTDLILLKRHKPGTIAFTKPIGADRVEVEMGGLGNRPAFDNQCLCITIRKQFLDKAKKEGVEIYSFQLRVIIPKHFQQNGVS